MRAMLLRRPREPLVLEKGRRQKAEASGTTSAFCLLPFAFCLHMSDIPAFPYDLLWGERSIRSVANLTRQDGREFFERTRGIRIKTQRQIFPLERANDALRALRNGEMGLRTED